MQTEIDQFLIEQNSLLTQQINSLQSMLHTYNELEQNLKQEIRQLEIKNQTQEALITAMKNELTKLEQGELSEDLQNSVNNQLTTVLNQLNLENTVNKLMQPFQKKLNTQQEDIEKALLTILQNKNFYNDLEMQAQQINTLEDTINNLVVLVKNLND